MSRNWRVAVAVAAALAFLFKLYLALYTQGTLDAAAFADHLVKIEALGGVGAYRVSGAFNNPFNSPPFIIHFLKALGWLTHSTALPFAFWLRLPCILADACSLLLVWKLLARSPASHLHAPMPRHNTDAPPNALAPSNATAPRDVPAPRECDVPLLLIAFALSPVSIIISGFHGNTDPVMIFFVLLSAYLLETQEGAWRVPLAAIAFGLALNIKVAPLIFAPVLWFYLPGMRRRIEYFGLAALVFLCGSLPYLLSDPAVIAQSVFGYASIYGYWGWTQLAATWLPESLRFARPPHDVVGAHALAAAVGKWLMLALIVAAALWQNRRAHRRPPLPLQLGLAAALFLFLTPGFGSQYLSWLAPWVVFLGLRASLAYYIAGGLYLSVSYSCYIYRAAPPFYCVEPLTFSLPLICWASVFAVLICYARLLRQQSATVM
ncbi:MAG TPA: hypothetical protein VGB61_06730 [Pyrinomonadaceae bacterium]